LISARPPVFTKELARSSFSCAFLGNVLKMSGDSGLEIGDISELMQHLGAIVWESFAGKWSVTFVSRHIQRALNLDAERWNRDLTTCSIPRIASGS
jgi:hypothetical protein